VYHNNEWERGYRETDILDGFDPYSNSKSCSELVTSCYRNSFFSDKETAISTARAGNVIGGGDFACDRIIPDCVRAASNNEKIIVRNPHSVRPYQHVIEPLLVYLMIAQRQYDNKSYAGCYNVGPDDCDCVSTGALADIFCEVWGSGQTWSNGSASGARELGGLDEEAEKAGELGGQDKLHEAGLLKLDCSKLKSVFTWTPRWNIRDAVEKTVEWTRAFMAKDDVCPIMDRQIEEYQTGAIKDEGI
jgi:CDP-glucose 4,6-dehydratase